MSKNLNDSSSSESQTSGDYELMYNEIFQSKYDQYKVLEYLGRGTYGQVVKCWKRGTQEIVAIKVLKSQSHFVKQGQIEINILTKLNENNPNKYNFVRTYEYFEHRNHLCIVFEYLQTSLYDYVRKNSLLKLADIRIILKQLLVGLVKLKELGIIHTDLKPENIMLVDPIRQHCRVKIIDFGTAININQTTSYTYIQSRYYRAPEVILGLPFSEAIDMWSLGCVAAEMMLGFPLYPGSCQFDQIRFICHTQGQPPHDMLDSAPKTTKFFNRGAHIWQLKSLKEYQLETNIKTKETRKYKFSCLDDVGMLHISKELTGDELLIEQIYRRRFTELLKKMLKIDQNKRIAPSDALNHLFVTNSASNSNLDNFVQMTEDNDDIVKNLNRVKHNIASKGYTYRNEAKQPAEYHERVRNVNSVARSNITYQSPHQSTTFTGLPNRASSFNPTQQLFQNISSREQQSALSDKYSQFASNALLSSMVCLQENQQMQQINHSFMDQQNQQLVKPSLVESNRSHPFSSTSFYSDQGKVGVHYVNRTQQSLPQMKPIGSIPPNSLQKEYYARAEQHNHHFVSSEFCMQGGREINQGNLVYQPNCQINSLVIDRTKHVHFAPIQDVSQKPQIQGRVESQSSNTNATQQLQMNPIIILHQPPKQEQDGFVGVQEYDRPTEFGLAGANSFYSDNTSGMSKNQQNVFMNPIAKSSILERLHPQELPQSISYNCFSTTPPTQYARFIDSEQLLNVSTSSYTSRNSNLVHASTSIAPIGSNRKKEHFNQSRDEHRPIGYCARNYQGNISIKRPNTPLPDSSMINISDSDDES